MRTIAVALVAVALAAANAPRVKRGSIQAAERAIDVRMLRVIENPYLLLGPTRGVYVEGAGATFSAELNLFQGPTVSPFRQTISNEDIAMVRAKKIERLPKIRESLREALMATAASLDDVPPQEQIAIGVTLLGLPYEETAGMPSQIVVQGARGKLIEAKLKGTAPAITLREY